MCGNAPGSAFVSCMSSASRAVLLQELEDTGQPHAHGVDVPGREQHRRRVSRRPLLRSTPLKAACEPAETLCCLHRISSRTRGPPAWRRPSQLPERSYEDAQLAYPELRRPPPGHQPGAVVCRPRRGADGADLGALLGDRLGLVALGGDARDLRRGHGRVAVDRARRRPPRPPLGDHHLGRARGRRLRGLRRCSCGTATCSRRSSSRWPPAAPRARSPRPSRAPCRTWSPTRSWPAPTASPGAFRSAGYMLGPGIGGALLAVTTAPGVFVVSAAMMAVSALLMVGIRTPFHSERQRGDRRAHGRLPPAHGRSLDAAADARLGADHGRRRPRDRGRGRARAPLPRGLARLRPDLGVLGRRRRGRARSSACGSCAGSSRRRWSAAAPRSRPASPSSG